MSLILPAWRVALGMLAVFGYCSVALANNDDLAGLELEALMDLEVTTVSKRVQPLSDTPSAVYVITSEEIRRSGVTSLPDALRLAPGVEVARLNRSTWAITIRGFNSMYSHNLLVLIDGRSIYSPFNGGVYWDSVMPMLEDIERIEVIRGPGASLWGVNAVSGVINIISKSTEVTQGVRTVVSVGNEENHLRVRSGGRSENLFYRGYAVHRDVESATNQDTGSSADDAVQGTQVGGRMDWTNGQSRLMVQSDFGKVNKSYNHSVSENLATIDNDFDSTTYNVLARWNEPLDESEMQFQFAFDHVDRNEPGYNYKLDTYDLDFQFNHAQTEFNRVTWGVNYRLYSDQASESEVIEIQDQSKTWNLYSVFVQNEFRATDDLHFVAGVKGEKVDGLDMAWQPTLRFNYNMSDEKSIWGSVSKAVRIPTRIENDSVFSNEFPEHLQEFALLYLFVEQYGVITLQDLLTTTKFQDAYNAFLNREDYVVIGEIHGTDNFKEEEVLSYELGYRWQPQPNIFVDLAAYYVEYDGLRGLEVEGWEQVDDRRFLVRMVPVNIAEAVSKGYELAFEYKPSDQWRFKFNYNHLKVSVEGDNFMSAAEFLEGASPENQFSFRTYYTFDDRYTFDVDFYYVDEIEVVGDISPDEYADINFRWSYQMTPQLNVAFVMMNLFNDHRFEYWEGLVGPQRTEIDRSFYIQLDWKQ